MATPLHSRPAEIEHTRRVDLMCVFGSRAEEVAAPVEWRGSVGSGL